MAQRVKKMNRKSFTILFASVLVFFTAAALAEAQSSVNIPAVPHTGPITRLIQDGNGNIISTGEDGFINLWNIQENAAKSRFQLSPYPIISMALRPDHPHITVVESDNMGLYRVSAWDYTQNKRLFMLRFKDPVSYITYSAGGSFLIAARNGRTGIVFIDPESGELLQSPSALNGTVSFAATGKSERTMITYLSSGVLSYWNLETGDLIQQAAVPQNIKSPILFNNNLLMAGIDKDGLVIIDALSGNELSRNNSITNGQLLVISEESREFVCIQNQDGNNRYTLLRMDNIGRLRIINQRNIPGNNLGITYSVLLENQIAMGTEDGKISLYQQRYNSIREMRTGDQLVIHETAAAGDSLTLLHNDKGIAFIPADFNAFSADTVMRFEDAGGYDRIIAADIPSKDNDFFVLWKSGNYEPVIRNSSGIIDTVKGLSERYPLRGCSVLHNRILFLDTAGNISVYNIDTKNIQFQYRAIGSLHASFVNENNIIAARNANAGNTPFLMIDISSGETVPLAYPADIGTGIYQGGSGRIYAAAVNRNDSDFITTIVNIDTSNPADSRSFVEYQGEDTAFSIAECEGNLATTLGGDGAVLFIRQDSKPFERSSGLPVKLLVTDNYFVALDSSGSIVWHDPSSGEIEAVFRVFDGKWHLQKKNGDTLEGTVQ